FVLNPNFTTSITSADIQQATTSTISNNNNILLSLRHSPPYVYIHQTSPRAVWIQMDIALGSIDVTPSGVQSVVFKTQPYIKIHSGAHFAYPSFEVVFRRYMKQSEDELLENYWCELVVLEEKEKEKENVTQQQQQQQQQQKPKPLVSNVWVNTPLVRLVISGPLASDPTNRTFVASCQITHLEQSLLQQGGPEFTVKLLITEYSYYNELAHFQVPVSNSLAKSRPVEFNINYMRDGRQVVSQGDGVALPTFDFVYRNEQKYEPYYFACRLEQPFSNWKQVTSSQDNYRITSKTFYLVISHTVVFFLMVFKNNYRY
ncbi:hypothetical protein TYRP_023108, partial [Tyrophagus putrescentiae]